MMPMTHHIASGKSDTGGGEGEDDDNVDSGNPRENGKLLLVGHRRFASGGACDTDGAGLGGSLD